MSSKTYLRNIGILAHVDAGKTTLTESLLYQSGSSRYLGSVDAGTSHSDTLAIERARGISVQAAQVDLTYKGHTIYLIDTPGHVDFIGEVERSLSILDGAIVVVSAVEGIQPQTKLYFQTLQKLGIPTLFFINKIDRLGADVPKVMADLRHLLTAAILPLPLVALDEEAISLLSEQDESLLIDYYEGALSLTQLQNTLMLQAQKGLVYPIFCGSALKGEGILDLLEGIIHYLPAPIDRDDALPSGIIYKISHHKTLGKLSHIRLLSGHIHPRDEILNVTTGNLEKIAILRKSILQKDIDLTEAASGELVVASGLDGHVGDILGTAEFFKKPPALATPLLTLKVSATCAEDYIPLVEALRLLEAEDPLLKMEWIKEKQEITLQIMGTIQIEILRSLLLDRFGIATEFSPPSVIYKETPLTSGTSLECYTMPKPCWAIVKFTIEPLPLGTGILYESHVRTEAIKLKYQREIEEHLPELLQQGLYGWPVTDLKLTLIEGEDHVMHSRPGDFAAATAMALMKGFESLGMTLLEPFIAFQIAVPESIGGKVLNDILQMRGTFESPAIEKETFYVSGTLPVATSLDYAIQLGILSSGQGVMSTQFDGYRPCPLALGTTRERIGVNPLERAKYILSVRHAL